MKFQRDRYMDISRWDIEKIMQLPDWCFGKRWWVGIYIGPAADEANYFLIPESVPDVFVLWDVLICAVGHTTATHCNVSLRLCRQVPNGGTLKTYRRLLRGLSDPKQFYDVHLPPVSCTHLGPMRNLIEARNDRIGGVFKLVAETVSSENQVACLISGIPREVPDWVVSGLAGLR